MSLTTANTGAISFKKISGKAHTQQNLAVSEEGISTNIQQSYSTVFGQRIESKPVTNSGLTSLYSTNGIVQRIKFPIDIIPNTQIGVNQSQGYRLKLPSDWNSHPGALYPHFSAGTYLHTALGKLQIVPALYGFLKLDGTTEYDPILYQTNGSTVIPKFDPINWYFDPYDGILFVEDPSAGYDINAARPGFMEAFLYVGDYMDDISNGTITGATNGLTVLGKNVVLGGTLTGNTSIVGSSKIFSIGELSAQPVASFKVQASTGITFTSYNGDITIAPNNGNLNLVHSGGAGNVNIVTNSGDVNILATNNTLYLKGDNGVVISGNSLFNFGGATYADDYSLYFGVRSLVDKGFVTGLTSAILTGSTYGSRAWLGNGAGDSASSIQTVYIGEIAGFNATDADQSIFIGYNSGSNATNADHSIFMGVSAGANANGANNSVFIGNAGVNASSANNSIFIGASSAGDSATNANNSVFIGDGAGNSATNANNSIFIGKNVGVSATGADHSIFIGDNSGYAASAALNSVFIGDRAGSGSTGAYTSIFVGRNAGLDAPNALDSVFIGNDAGSHATDSYGTVFIGGSSGVGADNAPTSVFIGNSVAYAAKNATASVFIGSSAGQNAINAASSIILGASAGVDATGATNSIIIGTSAGQSAHNLVDSVVIGSSAGISAYYASNSVFIGSNAATNATNAANSIFIGYGAGNGDGVDNTSGSSSILIGNSTYTGGFTNSIAIGNGANNSMSHQFLIGYEYVNWQIAGVDYVMPSSQAAAPGYALKNDGTGILSWGAIGSGSTSLTGSTYGSRAWLGNGAGNSASSFNTVFIGNNAGSGATNADESIYIGHLAGNGATDSTGSVFVGVQAGQNATNAANSIFIGHFAGFADSVDNTSGSTSILIGKSTSTGGNRNSIAIGANAINTKTHQFLVESQYTNWQIAGIDYMMPLSQADGAGYVLSNDGSGILSWNISLDGSTDGTIAWLGSGAGDSGASTVDTIFIGNNAGASASGAVESTFIGYESGINATNAQFSTFIGFRSGKNATNAQFSTFIGARNVGRDATNASYSIFIGNNAGDGDTINNTGNTGNAILIGNDTNSGGFNEVIVFGNNGSASMNNQFKINPQYINWQIAGIDYVMPSSQAAAPGYALINDGSGGLSWSVAGGGTGSTSLTGSTYGSRAWLGNGAGNGSSSTRTVYIGENAGVGATNADESIIIGYQAGNGATNALESVFIGYQAGLGATDAIGSIFIGTNAGYNATSIITSVFIGNGAGFNAANASTSHFIGNGAGYNAANAANSTFIGLNSGGGSGAVNAANSVFIGDNAGLAAINSANSVFIGNFAGFADNVDNTSGSTSILIGKSTSTGGHTNSIAIGANASNTKSHQFLIGYDYVNWQIAGVDYVMPTGQAVGTLENDGSGNLSWGSSGTIVTGVSYTISASTGFIGVSGSSAATIYLPVTPVQYKSYTISDIAGNALTFNITIDGNGYLIQGSSTAIIDNNFSSITFVFNGFNWSVTAIV